MQRRRSPKRKPGRFAWEVHEAARQDNTSQLKKILERGDCLADIQYGSSGDTVLVTTARANRPNTARLLIEKGADIDGSNKLGWTAVMTASWWNSGDVCQHLVSAGADCLKSNTSGLTALHLAARAGNIDILECLLQKCSNPDIPDILGWSPLHYASFNGYKDIVGILLNKSANVNCRNERGETALMLAVATNNYDIVLYLIESGASVNRKNRVGQTAIHYIVKNERILDIDRVKLLDLLVLHGADVNIQDKSGVTALMISSGLGCVMVADSLLKFHADVNLLDKMALSSLDYAASSWDPLSSDGHLVIANLLLSNKIVYYLDAHRDHLGRTSFSKLKNPKYALFLSVKHNLVDLFDNLLSKAVHVDVNYRDKYGRSCLMLAAKYGHLDILVKVIGHGADVTSVDNSGNTALIHAVAASDDVYELKNQPAIVSELLNCGAKPSFRNKLNQTSLMIADERKRRDIGELLLNKY